MVITIRNAPVKANFRPIVIFDCSKFFFLPRKLYKSSIGTGKPDL